MNEALQQLNDLADAGHLTREIAVFDARNRVVEYDSRVGWYVVDGGHKAIAPVTRKVRFSSEWMENE